MQHIQLLTTKLKTPSELVIPKYCITSPDPKIGNKHLVKIVAT